MRPKNDSREALCIALTVFAPPLIKLKTNAAIMEVISVFCIAHTLDSGTEACSFDTVTPTDAVFFDTASLEVEGAVVEDSRET